EPRSALAKTWTVSDNGLIYTFVLQEGRTFADGLQVNADAALYSFDRLMSTDTGRHFFPCLKGFERMGELTFRLILNRPWPPFLASLALPQASLVSPGLRNQPPDFLFARTLGSGRYQVYGWKDGTLGLQARPDLAAKPLVGLALFHYEPDPRERYRKMTAYRSHLTVAPDSGGLPWPASFRARRTPTFSVRFLALNTRRPYTKMSQVRRAIGAIVEDAFADRPGRLGGPFPDGLFYNRPGRTEAPEADPARADPRRQGALVLKEVGPPVLPLVLIYRDQTKDLDDDAKTIQAALAPHGLAVDLQPLAETQWRRARDKGQYDMLLDTRPPEIPAADLWLGRFLSSLSSPEGNPAFFEHPEADRLLEELAQTVTVNPEDSRSLAQKRLADQRAKILADLTRLAASEAPYVFLYQLERLLALDERLDQPLRAQEETLAPHPFWPEVWPLGLTNLRPLTARRSGVNPTGRPEIPEAPGPGDHRPADQPAEAEPKAGLRPGGPETWPSGPVDDFIGEEWP
ncbi:MAG: ABC transporter substrate-binding protein, partial [Candidatus Adiutrix sp.]|nr:ABC transporter substrate-binding protein [Candidatus Adiutrix sp.]